jgi:hypothetical protein
MHHPDFQAGWVVLKSSGGERAWFLAEGSEPRNKLILLAGKNQRAEESACLMKVKSDSHI